MRLSGAICWGGNSVFKRADPDSNMLLCQPLLVWIQPALPELDFSPPCRGGHEGLDAVFPSPPSLVCGTATGHRNPWSESEWAQIKNIWSVQQWTEPHEKPLHQAWLPDWVLQRGTHYAALSAHLGSCHAPGVMSLSLPTSRITNDWEKQCLINLVELLNPGNTEQDFAFVPQFPVCKTGIITLSCITDVCSGWTC